MSGKNFSGINRRDFIKTSVVGFAALSSARCGSILTGGSISKGKIALIKTDDRVHGVKTVMDALNFRAVNNKSVMVKPNFNSADATPGSTHNDTLSQLIKELHSRGAADITVGERSGPPKTNDVMEEKGIFKMAGDLNFKTINYEELPEEDWVHFKPEGCHWDDGFYLARPAVEAEYFVSTCCLKTHAYGGHYTMSIKLAFGLTPKKLNGPLHSKSRTDMRAMLTELNQCYKPDLIVLDGVNAFVDGGPSRGTLTEPNVIIAGTDRVAVDAVGVAILKEQGSNDTIMGRKIFEQDQLKRALEVKLGISGPEEIEFVTTDKASESYSKKLQSILAEG